MINETSHLQKDKYCRITCENPSIVKFIKEAEQWGARS